jgi:hypothetical protein
MTPQQVKELTATHGAYITEWLKLYALHYPITAQKLANIQVLYDEVLVVRKYLSEECNIPRDITLDNIMHALCKRPELDLVDILAIETIGDQELHVINTIDKLIYLLI